MSDPHHPGEAPAAELRRLVNGYQVSQAIHVAATLGIADRLAGGPCGSDELAVATGTDPGALYRLLRALASVGVFTELDDRRFELTAVGQHLRAAAAPTLHGWAAFIGRPYYWEAWSHLLDSVRTGENAFRLTHGMGPWEYRAAWPDEGAIFDRAMSSLTGQVSAAVVKAYDFTPFRRVVDVGGGSGAFVAELLSAYPTVSAVVFDQPHVVANLEPVLAGGPLADRCTVVSGDFFSGVPEGADAYVLKSVIHDWPDAESIEILAACRAAGGTGSTILLVERALAGPNEGPDNKFSDLNMLVGPGGKERTVDAYRTLFEAAGCRLTRVVPTASPVMVLEATAGEAG
jgi:hypothetical protein